VRGAGFAVVTGEDQSQDPAYNLFLYPKNSSWQAKQLIPHTTVMFYSDCVNISNDVSLNFVDKRIGCFIMTSQSILGISSQCASVASYD
jgi:hypothetical protein